MIIRRVAEGWQPYFLNFMFKHVPGKAATKIRVMTAEVTRVYATLLPHVIRKPHAQSWRDFLPMFIGCPDLPVPKTRNISIRAAGVNDGWHFNGVLLIPPPAKCRLKCQVQDHFRKHKECYIRRDHPLHRIHAEPMTQYFIADYVFKHFQRGNVAADDILILPRASSEMPRRRIQSDRDRLHYQ